MGEVVNSDLQPNLETSAFGAGKKPLSVFLRFTGSSAVAVEFHLARLQLKLHSKD